MELVEIKNNQPVTTSLQVSEVFNKNHKDVLEAYDNLRLQEGVAENSADLFYEDMYIHPQNKQAYRLVIMTKKGWTLLAMGFTGKKATKFKLDYINAFDEMENHIKQQLPTTFAEALRLAADLEEDKLLLEQKVAEYEPKINYLDMILGSTDTVTISQIAADYGMSAYQMNKSLNKLGVQHKVGGQWILYKKHMRQGYVKSHTTEIPKSGGGTKTVMNTKWTQKGRLFIYELLKEDDIYPVMDLEETA